MRILILLLSPFCLELNAQTVIDYSNASGTTCLFTSNTNVPATIDGNRGDVIHLTTVGQIDNDATTFPN